MWWWSSVNRFLQLDTQQNTLVDFTYGALEQHNTYLLFSRGTSAVKKKSQITARAKKSTRVINSTYLRGKETWVSRTAKKFVWRPVFFMKPRTTAARQKSEETLRARLEIILIFNYFNRIIFNRSSEINDNYFTISKKNRVTASTPKYYHSFRRCNTVDVFRNCGPYRRREPPCVQSDFIRSVLAATSCPPTDVVFVDTESAAYHLLKKQNLSPILRCVARGELAFGGSCAVDVHGNRT